MVIIGRDEEQQLLEQVLASEKPEFLAIYGRRRIGKTYLIRSFFETKKVVFFNVTGLKKGSLREQINNFTQQIGEIFFHGVLPNRGKNWNETFKILTDAIHSVPQNKKIIFFFDEFPWMSTKNSKLLQNLDYYWNQYWSRNKRIKLIICGSSASWIIDKIIANKGGLHNRVTHTIHLEPFSLKETKQFLNYSGVKLNNKQIAELYMVMGGIPHYLSKIKKGLSATQIIEKLAFNKRSFLLNEFENLYASLFDDYDLIIDIVKKIASTRYGMTQEELFKTIKNLSKGIVGLKKLKSLEEAGFIQGFKPHFHKRKGIHYKVIDEYTLFYLRWIEPIKKTLLEKNLRPGYWEKIKVMPDWLSWAGYSFESICFKHIAQISDVLQLSPTAIPDTWRFTPPKKSNEPGAQIDLLFDRDDDDTVTLCEIKYTIEPFILDKQHAQKLQQKEIVFKKSTKTIKQIFWVMISANGIKSNMYSEEMIHKVVMLEDLF